MQKHPRASAAVTGSFLSCKQTSWLAASIGFCWYLAHGGAGTLNPLQTEWLRSEDLSQHFLGWLHFRHADWQWPLGRIPQLGYPVGTTVGFMDANPWLSLLSRPFARFLPTFWQFQGAWLASCYTGLALSACWVARLWTHSATSQLLVAALCTTAPPALLRVCHENLAAQWLLLGGIYLCLRDGDRNGAAARTNDGRGQSEARGCALLGGLLLAVSLGVHAYLAVMLLPLLVAAVTRRWLSDRTVTAAQWSQTMAAYAAITLGLLFAFGFLGTGIATSEPGFGLQTADLLALINPVGWSRFLPSYPHTVDQFEGFSYLGLGNLALALLGPCLLASGRLRAMDKRRWATLFALAGLYALFALSDTVWFGGKIVFSVRPWTEPVLPLLAIFRASGRFVWLLHYVLVLFAAAAVLHALPARQSNAVLAICLAVQLVDLQPQDVREKLVRREPSPLQSAAWQHMRGDYQHLALYPAMYPSNRAECGWNYPWGHQVPYSFAAYAADMSINSNYAGRADAKHLGAYCLRFNAEVAAGQFDDRTVYVVGRGFEAKFANDAKLLCRTVDGSLLCVVGDRDTALTRWLAQQRT